MKIEDIYDYVVTHEENKRLIHTLNVADECENICNIFGISGEEFIRLKCAALLHDITKNYTPDKHKEICDKYNIKVHNDDYSSPTIHAITGAYISKELFPEFISDDEFNAILYHTTGRKDISLKELILFLSDYIERGREYETCKKTREKFYSLIKSQEPISVLRECALDSCLNTMESLKNKNAYIDPNTIDCAQYLKGMQNS